METVGGENAACLLLTLKWFRWKEKEGKIIKQKSKL